MRISYGQQVLWEVGDLVRYGDGATALMRITHIDKSRCHQMPGCRPSLADYSYIRYYGRAFHSNGNCTNREHLSCREASEQDYREWAKAHDENDKWIPGRW